MSGISVIVPTLGAPGLSNLVRALDEHPDEHELLIVDNTGGGLPDPARLHRRVRVLSPSRNIGFGRAVNLAAAAADGSTLVVTNDDCVPARGFLHEMAEVVLRSRGDEVGAGVLLQARQPTLIDSAGVEVDSTLLPFEHLHGQPLSVLVAGVPDPIGATGGAMAIARDLFLEIGGYDERLFAYQEDVDLSLRLRIEGISTRLARGAHAVHAHSSTLGSGSARKNYLMGYGRGFLLRKWGVLSGRRLLPVLARETTICAGQLILDRNAAGVRGRVRGYRAVGHEFAFPAAELASYAADGPALGARLRRRIAMRGPGDPA